MSKRDQTRDSARGDRSDDRNHLEHASHDREEQDKGHLQDREADERRRRHHSDQEHLTTNVSAEKCVHLGEKRNQLVALARRKDPTEPLKETRRIAQQEERRDEEY